MPVGSPLCDLTRKAVFLLSICIICRIYIDFICEIWYNRIITNLT